jgi:hypothetical protein
VGNRSLPFVEVVPEPVSPVVAVVVVAVIVPGGGGTCVKAFNMLFALAPNDADDPDRDDDADGDRDLTGVRTVVLVVLHAVAPGAGGVLNVAPDRVRASGDVCSSPVFCATTTCGCTCCLSGEAALGGVANGAGSCMTTSSGCGAPWTSSSSTILGGSGACPT